MKKFTVECRRNNTEEFQNWVGDYIEAESAEEAVEYCKTWLVENDFPVDEISEVEFKVIEA